MKHIESHQTGFFAAEIERAVEHVQKQGWYVIEGVVPAEDIASIREVVLKEERLQNMMRTKWVRTSMGSADKQRNQKLSKAEDIVPRLGERGKFLLEPRLMNVLQRMLGGYVRISSDYGIVTFPGNEREFWHSDWPYNQTVAAHIPQGYGSTVMHIGSLVMLTDFTLENGGTWVLPGTHLLDHNPTSGSEGALASSSCPGEIQVTGMAGSVVVYDARLWHCIAENRSAKPRVALGVRFAPWWLNLEVRRADSIQARMVEAAMRGRSTPVPALSHVDFDELPSQVKPLYQHRLAHEAYAPLLRRENALVAVGENELADDTLFFDLRHTRYALPMTQLAIRRGLFDFLEQAPASVKGVALFLDCSERAAQAMLAIEAALGLLIAHDDGRFFLSETARSYFLRSSPFYRPNLLEPEDALLQRLQSAFAPGHDAISPLAGTLANDAKPGLEDFVQRMDANARAAAQVLAQKGPWAGVKRLLDVGGGAGAMSIALAERYPDMHCTVLENKHVAEIAARNIAARSLSHRVAVIDQDMLTTAFPDSFDAVLFSNIFHNWDEATCQNLANRAFAALAPGGVVALHEVLLNARKDGPLAAACFSAVMLLSHRGQQYCFSELQTMLTKAGFIDCSAKAMLGRYHLVCATKPRC